MKPIALATVATVLIGLPNLASANVFITTDQTISTNLTSMGQVIIGYPSLMDFAMGIDPTSPTVQLVAGGQTGAMHVANSSVLNITGGSAGELIPTDDSTTTMSAGSVSFFNVEGGTVTVTGGTVGGFEESGTSTVNFSGGTLGSLNIGSGSTFSLFAGTPINGTPTAPYVTLVGILNIYGSGLSITGTAFGAGINTIYTIGGKLEDGTVLSGFTVEALSPANFNLINTPEPVFWVLIAAGLAGLFGYRRWRPLAA